MKARKLRMCKGYAYSNASHLMLFAPIQISNVSRDINLFKLRGTLGPDSVIP